MEVDYWVFLRWRLQVLACVMLILDQYGVELGMLDREMFIFVFYLC